MTTIVFAGMSVGAVTWGWVADTYGRKASLLVSTSIILVAGASCAFAQSFAFLLVGRLVVGFGVSGAHVAFSLLVEWMPPRYRGRMGIALCVWWSVGAVAEATLARIIMPWLGWRYLLGASALPAVLLLCAGPWIPESPRYYVSRGRQAEAQVSLEMAAISCGVTLPCGKLADRSATSNETAKASDLFSPELRRLTVSQWGLWFAAAFTYYGCVLITTELLAADRCEYAAPSGDAPAPSACRALTVSDYNANIVATTGELPGIAVTFLLIDRLGRKRTIGGEAMVMAVAMLLVIPCVSDSFQVS
ncbi:major facilitator superfamily domain-containing protein [Pavlovales sp. CCMP2436]|nr:major facilitator superfamily domain-containing protein [Pavlovales sp. CCMP2436]